VAASFSCRLKVGRLRVVTSVEVLMSCIGVQKSSPCSEFALQQEGVSQKGTRSQSRITSTESPEACNTSVRVDVQSDVAEGPRIDEVAELMDPVSLEFLLS
jgi:hypothetical protein